MAGIGFLSSIFKSIMNFANANVDKVAKEDGSRQECRPLSDVHMPPPQDEGSGSDEEGESEEGKLCDVSENHEDFQLIKTDDKYESDEENMEESCLRLIVALDRCMLPTAQSMMTTARSMVPTLPTQEHSDLDLDSDSLSDYSDTDWGDNWSVIAER